MLLADYVRGRGYRIQHRHVIRMLQQLQQVTKSEVVAPNTGCQRASEPITRRRDFLFGPCFSIAIPGVARAATVSFADLTGTPTSGLRL